jgi:hypothetical protein
VIVESDREVVMTWLIVLLAVAGVAAVAFVLWRRPSMELQRRFGPEYDRVLDDVGDRRRAEAELRERAERRDALELRELTPEEREEYASRLKEVELRFVDDPRRSVAEAHALVGELMRERGYPLDGIDDRIALISVDNPEAAEHYRHAYRIQTLDDAASTDDLRHAFQRYRAVFTAL